MRHHVVAIPTFKRPEAIARALDAVLPQLADLPHGESASLLVVDNDPAESGREAVQSRGVRYVVEPSPGIAAVRNRALHECSGATTVIFLDDDEVAEPGWLAAITRVYRDLQPTAVAGKVLTPLPRDVDRWVRASGAFERPKRHHLQLMPEAATNNLLLDCAAVERLKLRFNEQFGLTGGSDSMFTRLLTQRAGTIRWAEDAVVVEQEDPARFSRNWVLMRMFRFGNSATRVNVTLEATALGRLRARTLMVFRGAVRIVGGAIRWLRGVLTRSLLHRSRGLITVYRGAGMIAGSAGYAYNEYGRRRRTAERAASKPGS
ncbi:glycosyltransferase [Microbacterium sp. ARD32]|uniref:glycosyltransferase family 2 protein n=1 Tax=Microbacterium sp. ARD32 TaxID=2962577 RepID=UPI00288114C2|nr:glycosyltransferase [Microbacterium sp. ARD32]MDT0156334.1 glycosyltransferase [Microbacterium sp. ARD32]